MQHSVFLTCNFLQKVLAKNTLANLQLLEGRENESKNDTSLIEWMKNTANAENSKYMPQNVPLDIAHFDKFLDERQKLMSETLKSILI